MDITYRVNAVVETFSAVFDAIHEFREKTESEELISMIHGTHSEGERAKAWWFAGVDGVPALDKGSNVFAGPKKFINERIIDIESAPANHACKWNIALPLDHPLRGFTFGITWVRLSVT